jgi:hypothetical protein
MSTRTGITGRPTQKLLGRFVSRGYAQAHGSLRNAARRRPAIRSRDSGCGRAACRITARTVWRRRSSPGRRERRPAGKAPPAPCVQDHRCRLPRRGRRAADLQHRDRRRSLPGTSWRSACDGRPHGRAAGEHPGKRQGDNRAQQPIRRCLDRPPQRRGLRAPGDHEDRCLLKAASSPRGRSAPSSKVATWRPSTEIRSSSGAPA